MFPYILKLRFVYILVIGLIIFWNYPIQSTTKTTYSYDKPTNIVMIGTIILVEIVYTQTHITKKSKKLNYGFNTNKIALYRV